MLQSLLAAHAGGAERRRSDGATFLHDLACAPIRCVRLRTAVAMRCRPPRARAPMRSDKRRGAVGRAAPRRSPKTSPAGVRWLTRATAAPPVGCYGQLLWALAPPPAKKDAGALLSHGNVQISQLIHTYRAFFQNPNSTSVPGEVVLTQWKQMKKLIVSDASLSRMKFKSYGQLCLMGTHSSSISSCVWLASLSHSQSTRVAANA